MRSFEPLESILFIDLLRCFQLTSYRLRARKFQRLFIEQTLFNNQIAY
jgi:hypothetical protein